MGVAVNSITVRGARRARVVRAVGEVTRWPYLAVSPITIVFHMPLNVRFAAAVGAPLACAPSFHTSIALVGPVTGENAGAIRAAWLLGHIPCVLITLAIPLHVLRALAARQQAQG
jgi:hypothetical protein